MLHKNGNIYLKYRPHNQAMIQVGNDVPLVIVVKNDVALLELGPENIIYLNELRQKTCGCCGSEYRCFDDPTVSEIERWLS